MAEKIGTYLQERLRNKNIKNEEAAGFLNVAVSTFRKYFSNEDMPVEKLISLSKLMDEDIIYNFYYAKEPLKTIHQRIIKNWEDQINELSATINRQKETIDQLKDHLETQKEFISSLKREIELLKGK